MTFSGKQWGCITKSWQKRQREDKDMQGQTEYYSVTLSTAGFAVLLKINLSDLERPLDLFSEVSFGPWFKLSLQVCFILVFLAIYLSYVFLWVGGPRQSNQLPLHQVHVVPFTIQTFFLLITSVYQILQLSVCPSSPIQLKYKEQNFLLLPVFLI